MCDELSARRIDRRRNERDEGHGGARHSDPIGRHGLRCARRILRLRLAAVVKPTHFPALSLAA